jgi:P27 family predicted phage terminase small subunit
VSAPLRLAPAAGLPDPPASLGPVGRAEWVRLWAAGVRWLHPGLDRPVMGRLCGMYDRYARISATIGDELTVPGRYGLRPHPLLGSLVALERVIVALEMQLGFTPQARAALSGAEIDQTSKLELMIQRRLRDDAS